LREPLAVTPPSERRHFACKTIPTHKQYLPWSANPPDYPVHLQSARHITSGPSKSVALNVPYSFTCNRTGSVSR
jgi:hypothetical protein